MPYCIADGFAQYLLCKTITAGSSTSTSISFNATTGNTQTKTYTIPQTYNTLYVVVDWTVYTPLAYGGGGANITVKQGNTTILNRGINKDENGTETIKLSNVASGTVITAIITPPAQTGQGGSYWDSSISGTIWITANQAGIIRPLKAVEVKEIGKQAYGLSFGRIDGKRYGEFDDKIYNSATTGSITIGNCIGFKIISDSNGEQYKIPIFGV